MRYFYDTEFVEDGRTIDLISIGIVAEDGREYYAVVNNPATIQRAIGHEWLVANVLPALPVKPKQEWRGWAWDATHFDCSRIKDSAAIAADVSTFLLSGPGPVELWAWYGAYDHVALSQLWGSMADHPDGIPIWTNDLRQEQHRLGDPPLPEQISGLHNALADARHLKIMFDALYVHSPNDQDANCWWAKYDEHDNSARTSPEFGTEAELDDWVEDQVLDRCHFTIFRTRTALAARSGIVDTPPTGQDQPG